eukprot:449894_1
MESSNHYGSYSHPNRSTSHHTNVHYYNHPHEHINSKRPNLNDIDSNGTNTSFIDKITWPIAPLSYRNIHINKHVDNIEQEPPHTLHKTDNEEKEDSLLSSIDTNELLESPHTLHKIDNNNIIINHDFKIKPYNIYDEYSGILQLFCKQKIEISLNGIINANGCGYNYSSKLNEEKKNGNNDLTMLRFGAGNYNNKNSSGGGIIELISLDMIINKGRIQSNGLFNGSGGSIKIKCKKFINEGIISAKNNGKICIVCQEYFDKNDQSAYIIPKPNIINVKNNKSKWNGKQNIFTPICNNYNNINLDPKKTPLANKVMKRE